MVGGKEKIFQLHTLNWRKTIPGEVLIRVWKENFQQKGKDKAIIKVIDTTKQGTNIIQHNDILKTNEKTKDQSH